MKRFIKNFDWSFRLNESERSFGSGSDIGYAMDTVILYLNNIRSHNLLTSQIWWLEKYGIRSLLRIENNGFRSLTESANDKPTHISIEINLLVITKNCHNYSWKTYQNGTCSALFHHSTVNMFNWMKDSLFGICCHLVFPNGSFELIRIV